ncbi:hypothetical protein PVAP13_7NG356124 [Panicum virgatum]|uniref:Uncharacterized protein n=1 Tax=Panicum virgatum TaxID=38727 RepID=A0A8T0QAW6_PANVG|nr:hypothetical protein PVAP13_7NG356124 [Panicum virgatum]
MHVFYRVRLYLDGIPGHAWTLELVERIVGRRCALQCINSDLVQPLDTRHINLPSDRSSAVAVLHEQPDRWQQGVRYEIFIHLGVIEDSTAVAQDLQGTVSNPAAFKPVRRGYAWRYGLADGSLADTIAKFSTRLPLPPREPVPSGDSLRPRRDDTLRLEDTSRERARVGRPQERSDSLRLNRGRTCKDAGFIWLERRHDDDEDDDDVYDHPGWGGNSRRWPWNSDRAASDAPRHERMRSPRCHDSEFKVDRRRQCSSRLVEHSFLRTLQLPLPALTELSAMSADELRATFLRQAEALKSNALVGVDVPAGAWLQHAADYINKASLLADKIAITTEAPACRNGAWSAPKECERLIPGTDTLSRTFSPGSLMMQTLLSRRWSEP